MEIVADVQRIEVQDNLRHRMEVGHKSAIFLMEDGAKQMVGGL